MPPLRGILRMLACLRYLVPWRGFVADVVLLRSFFFSLRHLQSVLVCADLSLLVRLELEKLNGAGLALNQRDRLPDLFRHM